MSDNCPDCLARREIMEKLKEAGILQQVTVLPSGSTHKDRIVCVTSLRELREQIKEEVKKEILCEKDTTRKESETFGAMKHTTAYGNKLNVQY